MAKKILVIEDEKDVRDSITYALEEYEYEVIASEDANVLKRIDSIKPDLILMDNWLTEWSSDANGAQLSKQLKSDPKTADIPIIIVSAMNNIQEIAEAGKANAYLKKPFNLDELLEAIKPFVQNA